MIAKDIGTFYRIVVRSELSDRYAVAFEGLEMKDVETILTGEVIDQPHFYAILDRRNGLGLELLSVQALPDNAPRVLKVIESQSLHTRHRSSPWPRRQGRRKSHPKASKIAAPSVSTPVKASMPTSAPNQGPHVSMRARAKSAAKSAATVAPIARSTTPTPRRAPSEPVRASAGSVRR